VKSRTALLNLAVSVIAQLEKEAAADARLLSFEQPRLVAAGLKNGISLVQQLRDAVKQGNLALVGEKAEALLAVLGTLSSTMKVG
jgi:hypothetical protein